MVVASILALALAAAAADGPVATSPAVRAEEAKAVADAAASAPKRDPEIPASAPADDYGFVAWCHGALAGHMELHDRVKPELDKVSPGRDDGDILKAGRDYLALYAAALKAAEAASPTNIHDKGVEADAAGYRIWAAARAAEPRTQMWSYLMWELPPRCEIAAKRLEERSNLLGAALKPGSAAEPAAPADPAAPTTTAAADAGPLNRPLVIEADPPSPLAAGAAPAPVLRGAQ